jgi:hypothetical protein
MNVLDEVVSSVGPDLAEHASPSGSEPRFALPDPARAFVLEAVYEGYRMHYGTPRLFARMDDDLGLLGGDALYALGLSRLAETGDLEAVAELADLISRSARAHAEGRADEVEAMWDRTARALARWSGSCAP